MVNETVYSCIWLFEFEYKYGLFIHKMDLVHNDLIGENEFKPVPCLHDGNSCFLCSIDPDSQIMRMLDNCMDRLSDRCKECEIYKTMVKVFAQHATLLTQQNIQSLKPLKSEDFQVHYSKHYISPKRHLLKDLMSINLIMEELRKNHLMESDSGGKVLPNYSAINKYKQLSHSKMELIKLLGNIHVDMPIIKVEPYKFD